MNARQANESAQQAKIRDRIAKLLRLAKSSNVQEAANAAAHAQRLLEQHNIAAASVDETGSRFQVKDHGDDPLLGGRRIAPWRWCLVHTLAELNGCATYVHEFEPDGYQEVCLIGTTEDVDHVRAMFGHLTREVERLAVAYKPRGKKSVRVAKSSFRLGAVDMIEERMVDVQREVRRRARCQARDAERRARRSNEGSGSTGVTAPPSSAPLAIIDRALARLDERAKDAERLLDDLTDPGPPVGEHEQTIDPRAYAAGLRAGGRVSLEGAVRG